MTQVRVCLLVYLAAAALQQAHALEILHGMWRFHRIDHEANIVSSRLEPGIDGVEPDTFARVRRRHSKRQAVMKNGAQFGLHELPIAAHDPRTSLTAARGIAVNVDRP